MSYNKVPNQAYHWGKRDVTQGACSSKLRNGMLWPHIRPWEGFYTHIVFIQDDWTSTMHIWTLVPLGTCYLEGGALDEHHFDPQTLDL